MVYLRVNEMLKEKKKSKYWFVKNMEGGYQALTHLMNNETSSIHFSTLEKLCNIFECDPRRFNCSKKRKKERCKKMSKLLKQYNELKKQDNSFIYLFRVGIFYNILNEDAKIINNKIGLKITNLSPEIIKCGFPVSTIDKYKKILTEKNIKFKIIDNLPKNMSTTDYMNNIEIKKILNTITNLDMNNTTFQQSFNILLDMQQKLKNIK